MPVAIPESITVHLGAPDSNARNITVSFIDYIKNVASSEIYPTWPESALRANILAQISVALNRIYTEWYPSRGYNFDITNSTQYDQAFFEGRDIFENIDRIVDDIFDNYLKRPGAIEPLFAQFCNGTTSVCEGLSQWGSVELANQGLTPYEILTYYFGNDLEIIQDAPIAGREPSYPGTPLQLGSSGLDVLRMQLRLNRISQNYPAIPKIYYIDGEFGQETEEAVRKFQQIFNLTPDGIVGRQTWYRIITIYNAVKRLAELNSEGEEFIGVPQQFVRILREGDSGDIVRLLQYFLAAISDFYPTVPFVVIDGVFGSNTRNAVTAFQQEAGLTPDGIVGRNTWNALYNAYLGVAAQIPPVFTDLPILPYPGRILREGVIGEDVRALQQYINALSQFYPTIPNVTAAGVYGPNTVRSIRAAQETFGLPVDGITGPQTWNQIVREYETAISGSRQVFGQYPGYELQAE